MPLSTLEKDGFSQIGICVGTGGAQPPADLCDHHPRLRHSPTSKAHVNEPFPALVFQPVLCHTILLPCQDSPRAKFDFSYIGDEGLHISVIENVGIFLSTGRKYDFLHQFCSDTSVCSTEDGAVVGSFEGVFPI